jgi:tetratricopeptide (TPR) repeat protein
MPVWTGMEDDMSNYEFWIELGNIYKAINAYQEKAIEFNKRFIFPWIRLGNIFDKQSRSEDAIKAYQKAIELDPQNANVWNEIGNVHLKTGDFTKAEEAYRKAMEYDPSSGWPCSNLALSYFRQARYAEAIPLFLQSIELFQDDKSKAASWNRLGNTYQRLDDNANAIAAYQKADSLDPNSAALRNNPGGFLDEPDAFSDGTINENVESNATVTSTPKADLPAVIAAEDVPVDATASIEEGSGISPQIESPTDVALANENSTEALLTSVPLVVEATETNETQPEQPASEVVEDTATTSGTPAEIATPINAISELTAAETEVASPTSADSSETDEKASSVPVVEVQTDSQVHIEEVAPPLPKAETVVVLDDKTNLVQVETISQPETLMEPSQEAIVVPEVKEEQPAAEPAEVAVTPEVVLAVAEPTASIMEEQRVSTPAEESILHQEEPIASGEGVETPEVQSTDAANETPAASSVEASKDESIAEPESIPEAEPQKVTPLAIVNAIIDADVKSAHVWNELGNIYISIGAYEQAIDVYHKSIELDPEYGWPYSNLALTYFSQGKYTEAIPLYQKSIELLGGNKEKATSWNRLGNAYRSMNNIENAAKAYKNAAALDPDNKSFITNAAELATEPEPVSKEAEKQDTTGTLVIPNDSAAFQAEPVSQSETVITTAEEAQVAGIESAPIADDVISVSPEADAIPEQALSLEAAPVVIQADAKNSEEVVSETVPDTLAQVSESVTSVKESCEPADADNPPITITNIEEKAEEPVKADDSQPTQANPDTLVPENVMQEASVEVDTKSAHIWNDLGRTYYNKGNFDDAIYAYKKAIDFDPEFGRPYGNLAAIYLRQGLYTEAIPLYQRSVELLESDNEKAVSWNKLGNAYRRLGDYDKAIAAYHMADELDPVNSRLPVQSTFDAMRTSFAQHGTSAVG